MKEFYVYVHLNPRTNEIFYVGKGKGHRKSSKTGRNDKWKKYVSDLGGKFKHLIIKNDLSEDEALVLERKIISKIDWHYDDKATNVTDSYPDLEDAPSIQIVFGDIKKYTRVQKHKQNIRFQNLSDLEIVETLLNFPNESHIKSFKQGFENICNYFNDNYEDLEEADEDIFYDIDSIIDSIRDLLTEYESSDKNCLDELNKD